MVKTHKNSKFSLLSLTEIRDTNKIILQIDDTQTNFSNGQKCYLCEVVDNYLYNTTKGQGELVVEICKLNDEKRKLERKIARLEKALKEREGK